LCEAGQTDAGGPRAWWSGTMLNCATLRVWPSHSANQASERAGTGAAISTCARKLSAFSGQSIKPSVGAPSLSTRTCTGPEPVQITRVPAAGVWPRAAASWTLVIPITNARHQYVAKRIITPVIYANPRAGKAAKGNSPTGRLDEAAIMDQTGKTYACAVCALAISFLTFSALADSSVSLALARNLSRPPR